MPGVTTFGTGMLATVRRGYLTTNSGQIHYYHAGDSGPLLFLFHETALSASEFERTLPFLGTRCRAIALDTPGYGMSDAPHQPLSMAALSAQFTEAINNFGNEPFILAGAHTGSSFALELATRQLAARTTHVIISGLALLKQCLSRLCEPEMIARLEQGIALPAREVAPQVHSSTQDQEWQRQPNRQWPPVSGQAAADRQHGDCEWHSKECKGE